MKTILKFTTFDVHNVRLPLRVPSWRTPQIEFHVPLFSTSSKACTLSFIILPPEVYYAKEIIFGPKRKENCGNWQKILSRICHKFLTYHVKYKILQLFDTHIFSSRSNLWRVDLEWNHFYKMR